MVETAYTDDPPLHGLSVSRMLSWKVWLTREAEVFWTDPFRANYSAGM